MATKTKVNFGLVRTYPPRSVAHNNSSKLCIVIYRRKCCPIGYPYTAFNVIEYLSITSKHLSVRYMYSQMIFIKHVKKFIPYVKHSLLYLQAKLQLVLRFILQKENFLTCEFVRFIELKANIR